MAVGTGFSFQFHFDVQPETGCVGLCMRVVRFVPVCIRSLIKEKILTSHPNLS